MNLVLAHCGKEWRSQRALLVAFTLLTLVCLSIGFLLLPKAWWQTEGNCAFALSCFVAAGVIGVLAFAAPALVRNEFAAKGDQFVRRLPGALGASFGGKLLFLTLATLLLPLVALLWGELFLQAIDQPWHDLFRWYWDGSVHLQWAWPAVVCGYALLLTPWVWAAGTWLPGGRMAVGGVVLLVLLLGMAVVPVLRQHPNLERGIAWQGWLWAVVPLGVAVAGIAWTKGRRGGGPLRSARFGLSAMAVGLVPPSLWFGAEAYRYRHPDPQALVSLDVRGLTPDLRFAVALGTDHDEWQPMTFRIDLQTGAAAQVAGFDSSLLPAAYAGFQSRWWIRHSSVALAQDWFDLATGEDTPLVVDARGRAQVSPEQQQQIAVARRACTPFRAPGDRRVWVEDDEICVEDGRGGVDRVHAPEHIVGTRAEGHGLVVSSPARARLFDPSSRTFLEVSASQDRFLVRDVLIVRPSAAWQWNVQRPGGASLPCPELAATNVLGLLDDDWLLCHRHRRTQIGELFRYRPADGRVEALTEMLVTPEVWGPLGRRGSLLPRDPAGRLWLAVRQPGGLEFQLLGVDSAARTVVRTFTVPWQGQLLGWPDTGSMLVRHEARIERIDLATGARTVLFPRP